MIRIILWKELVDLSRDWRTLASVVLLPMLGLPGLALLSGALSSTQQVSVAIVSEDPGALGFAEELAGRLESILESRGFNARVAVSASQVDVAGYDLVAVLPRGFAANLSRLDGTAVIVVSSSLGQAGDAALAALNDAVSSLSSRIVVARVSELASMAGVEVDAEGLLTPLTVRVGYHTASGAPASEEQALAAYTARILEFALFFVANPAIVYMADSIVGERERRTIEKLLVSPVGRGEILAGKMAAASILGLASSLVDSLGVVAFFYLSGVPLEATPGLAAVWFAVALLLVAATSSLVAAVSARSQSVRGAQNASFLVVMAALAVYFAALTVDLTRLPTLVSLLLQALPFTHAALAVHYYAIGVPGRAVLHAGVLLAYTVALAYLALRSFDSERLLASK